MRYGAAYANTLHTHRELPYTRSLNFKFSKFFSNHFSLFFFISLLKIVVLNPILCEIVEVYTAFTVENQKSALFSSNLPSFQLDSPLPSDITLHNLEPARPDSGMSFSTDFDGKFVI